MSDDKVVTSDVTRRYLFIRRLFFCHLTILSFPHVKHYHSTDIVSASNCVSAARDFCPREIEKVCDNPSHYGPEQPDIPAWIIRFPRGCEWVSEQVSEWAQQSTRVKRAGRSKRMSEQMNGSDERVIQYLRLGSSLLWTTVWRLAQSLLCLFFIIFWCPSSHLNEGKSLVALMALAWRGCCCCCRSIKNSSLLTPYPLFFPLASIKMTRVMYISFFHSWWHSPRKIE